MSSRNKHFTALCGVLALAGLAVGCGSAPSSSSHTGTASTTPTANDYPGVDIGSTASTLLHSGACTGGNAAGTGSLTITVKNGETAYLTLRPTDNMVVVNGVAADNCQLALAPTTAFPGQFPTGKTITIISDTVLANEQRGVILDYVNGMWGESTTGAVGVVSINLGTASGAVNSLKVRGTAGADAFYLGKGTGVGAVGPFMLNVNGGAAAPLDAFPDVLFSNIQTVIVSTGPGNDKIVADGTFGTTAAFPNALQLFGGDGNDVLTGGAGNDVLSGDLGGDTMTGGPGVNTYAMGTVAQGATGSGTADVITVNTTMMVTAVDTVDFSKRTGDVSVVLAPMATATSGESGEGMTIPDNISTILGGYGNDTISAGASTFKHTFKGGLGDDTLTGSSTTGVDTLIGGNGDAATGDGDDTFAGAKATVDYSARTSALTVNIDSAGVKKSGDLAGTLVAVQASTASDSTNSDIAAPVSGVSTLAGLAGMTADSVGHILNITGSAGAKDDGSYVIVAYTSATSVDIDVSGNAAFVADATKAFSFSEKAHQRAILPTLAAAAGTLTATSATVGTVDGLSNLNSHDVGKFLILSGTTGTTDDSGPLGYKILTVTGTSTATVDTTANSSFAADTVFSWSVVTNKDEADAVKAGSVNGSLTAVNTITAIDGGSHRIIGGAAADILTGGAGADTIYGMAGADTIYGGAGDDSLVGGDDADTLVGGDGNDLLEGDAGNDTFTCDGKNISSAALVGTAPGNTDITVDYAAGDLPSPKSADCEF